MRTTLTLACLLLIAAGPLAADGDGNLALAGTAKSWLPNSGPTVPPKVVNDADALTWWGSNEPTTDPPKDIGIEWAQDQRIGSVRVKFYSLGYVPALEGWALQAMENGDWRDLPARVENPDCEWWEFSFPPVTTNAVRLVVSEYASSRVAVAEFEVYPGQLPALALRRPPSLDGAFWAFHYEHWASRFDTPEKLAAEVDASHEVGMDVIILYTITGTEGVFSTVVPGTDIAQSPWWAGRDPVDTILSRADELGMRVYLGDANPTGFSKPTDAPKEAEAEALLNGYRKQMLERYVKHPSLVGYYINYECCPALFGNDPAVPMRNSQKLAAFVKRIAPAMHVVQPVGLYSWRESEDADWHKMKPDEAESFWRPYIAGCPDIDAFMVIDGVGTGLSPLNHTDANQALVRKLCDEYGKQMWTDVEIAEMGRRYETMPIGRVATSLAVAACHAETIVGFCYFNYMSPNNGRETSKKLYDDYRTYRLGVRTAAGSGSSMTPAREDN